MPSKLILMRHGRSLLNDGHHSSERNNVLTAKGVRTTIVEAEGLQDLGIHHVLSSPIPRAYQTAMIAVGALGRGVDITLHPELMELEPKDHEQIGYKDSEDAEMAWKRDIDVVPHWGLESQRMVYNRAVAFLEKVLPEKLGSGSVLLVSHYVTLRGIRSWLEHGTADRMAGYRPRNSMPTIYDGASVLKRIAGDRSEFSALYGEHGDFSNKEFLRENADGTFHVVDKAYVNGYHFGDRLLEDVWFELRIEGDRLTAQVTPHASSYFADLNQEAWLKACVDHAARNDLFYASPNLGTGADVICHDRKKPLDQQTYSASNLPVIVAKSAA